MVRKKEVKTRAIFNVLLLSVLLIMAGLTCRGKTGFSDTPPATSSSDTQPAVPSSVDAIPGNAQVTVSWAAVSGAASYNLYWSTTSGVTPANGTKLANVTSPYTQTGLTNGTIYYYIVTAVNSYGGGTGNRSPADRYLCIARYCIHA